MSAITAMDRQSVRLIAEELTTAAQEVAERHGLNIEKRPGRFDPEAGYFDCKVRFIIAEETEEGNVMTPEAKTFLSQATRFGMDPDHLFCWVMLGGVDHQIVGLAPRRPKYPVLLLSENGSRRKATAASVNRAINDTPAEEEEDDDGEEITFEARVTRERDEISIDVYAHGIKLDRPHVGGWTVGVNKMALAQRLKTATEAGVTITTDGTVLTDNDGDTYLDTAMHVLGRRMNADLKRLGF